MAILNRQDVLEKANSIRTAESGAPKRMLAADFVNAIGGSFSLTSFSTAANTLQELGFSAEAALVNDMSLDCD